MADKVTSSTYLSTQFGFADGDTRTVKIPNPRSNVTAAEVHAVSGTLTTNKLVIGDKDGAELTGILKADKVAVMSTSFDI